jgi:hypothetical protein
MRWHIPLDTSQYDDRHSLTDTHAAVAGFAAFLLKKADVKAHPEIVALAFWFRQANLVKISESIPFEGNGKKVKRVFHIAPANVDTVFMYSVLLSALCANQNIVRVSQRSGEVTWLLINVFKEYLRTEKGAPLARLISIVEYNAEQVGITEEFSEWADLRVIWGGNDAIETINLSVPHRHQICFPDRYSISVLTIDDKVDVHRMAKAFLTDILPFNQQACSSPKALFWLDTSICYQQKFWNAVSAEIGAIKHELDSSSKVEQQILLQQMLADNVLNVIESEVGQQNGFARVNGNIALGRCKLNRITPKILKLHTGNGLILECDICGVNELPFDAALQTISIGGAIDVDALANKEFKRHVKLGMALEFNTQWDGIDLLHVFSQ